MEDPADARARLICKLMAQPVRERVRETRRMTPRAADVRRIVGVLRGAQPRVQVRRPRAGGRVVTYKCVAGPFF